MSDQPARPPADPGPLGSEDAGGAGELVDRAPLIPAPADAPAPTEVPDPAEVPAPAEAPAPADRPPDAHAGAASPRPIAPKEYYSISEVCELVGLKPHVLRYWESQFAVLNPSKNRSGNRVYQRKEIKLILLVQHLLYEDKYTIEGARQRLDQLRRGGKSGELPQATSQALDAEMRRLLRDELTQLLDVLSPREADGAAAGAGRPASPAAPVAPGPSAAPGATRAGRSAE